MVDYLARYSHRIAITESTVTFRYKNYRKNGQVKSMSLPGKLFLKRFCLHILPPRFRKIRHYGFWANRTKTVSLNIAKMTLLEKRHLALSRTERRALAKARLIGKKTACPELVSGKNLSLLWCKKVSPYQYLGAQ